MRWVLYISLLMTTGAVVTNLVAVTLPYWLYSNNPQLKYQGLWWRCEPPDLTCEIILKPPELLDAVRVMMLFGLSFYIFALICSVMYTFFRSEKTNLITAATVLVVFGAVLCMVGVLVYGALYPRLLRVDGMGLHAGFGIAVVSTLIGFLNGFFYCMAKARGDVE